jgi:hypothetical protein
MYGNATTAAALKPPLCNRSMEKLLRRKPHQAVCRIMERLRHKNPNQALLCRIMEKVLRKTHIKHYAGSWKNCSINPHQAL